MLVGLRELSLTADGYSPRVETLEATDDLKPFQIPPNAVDVREGSTTVWAQAKKDQFSLLSIGTPITSDLAFLTMFNEGRTIEGGRSARDEEYGSERLYGSKRCPTKLRMLSIEVDDVLFQKFRPLDVLVFRVPYCSMPAPEAIQMQITTACVYDPKVATAYLNASLQAREAEGLTDCSTGPEMKIIDYSWRGQLMSESDPETCGLPEKWGLLGSDKPGWNDLHVDTWSVAQHVQRSGLLSETTLLALSKKDQSRRIWPIAIDTLKVRNLASSNAVKAVNSAYPWAGSGFSLGVGMSGTAGPGEDKSALVAAAQDPGKMNPEKGKHLCLL